jgi:hypothetical protein
MPELDLDQRLDELFATEPKEFTAVRDALVRELKADGHADEAARVKALRRPTVAVAAVNHVARSHADEVAELVELGAELAATQADAGADREQLRELTRERRMLLHRLTEAAAATTERPESARASITATLDTASLDEHLRGDLQRGRLTHELAPTARFVLGDDAPAAAATRAAPAKRATTSRRAAPAAGPPRDELAARRARAELETARQRAEEAERAVHEQADVAADATARLDAVHRQVADLEAALADARAELADAKRHEREAQRALNRARTVEERSKHALGAAARHAEEADD